MDSLFQKSLNDVLRGLRFHAGSEEAYLAQVLKSIRSELKFSDSQTKSMALLKLYYLHMYIGHEMTWACFPCIEVMSSAKLSFKHVGYLAACETFTESMDVILLTTHLLRKDLSSSNQHEASLALHFLSCISSSDLSDGLTPDVFSLLNSGRAMVRKKATVALLRLVQYSPETLKVAFRRLVERLDDSDPGVAMAAVNVVTELGMKDPTTYLPLAPDLFRLFTSSSTTWILIKLVKLFARMAVAEPRIIRKLSGPMATMISSTPSKSLSFECVRTVLTSMNEDEQLLSIAAAKVNDFIAEEDPNLRLLGLQSLLSIIPQHTPIILEHKANILTCLDHPDKAIQACTLKIICGIVGENTLVSTVLVLRKRMTTADEDFANHLAAAILAMSAFNHYERVIDFVWYLDILVDLAYDSRNKMGVEIGHQLIDISMKVEDVRQEAVLRAKRMVMDTAILRHPNADKALEAAAFILGEFSTPAVADRLLVIQSLLQPCVESLPGFVQSVYLQAVMKVLLFPFREQKTSLTISVPISERIEEKITSEEVDSGSLPFIGEEQKGLGFLSIQLQAENLESKLNIEGEGALTTNDCISESVLKLNSCVRDSIQPFLVSMHMEVQERASNLAAIVEIIEDDGSQLAFHIAESFSECLRPVAAGAQYRVPVPESLHLDGSLKMAKEKARLWKRKWRGPVISSEKARNNESESGTLMPDFSEPSAEPEAGSSVRDILSDPFYIRSFSPVGDDDDFPAALGDSEQGKSNERSEFPKLLEEDPSFVGPTSRLPQRRGIVHVQEDDIPASYTPSSETGEGHASGVKNKVSKDTRKKEGLKEHRVKPSKPKKETVKGKAEKPTKGKRKETLANLTN